MSFAILGKARRKRAIDRYLTALRPRLGKMFGRCERYSAEQIEAAIAAEKLRAEYAEFGMALYATADDLKAYNTARGSGRSVWEIREEIGNLFFSGNSQFTAQDVVDYAEMRTRTRSLGQDITEDGIAIAKYSDGA